MACRSPLSHSAQPQQRAWSLGKFGGKENGEDIRGMKKDGLVQENERTQGIEHRVEERNCTRLLLNTVERYCNICSLQLQRTFINSAWLLSYFTPKVTSKSIRSGGTVFTSGCVFDKIKHSPLFRELWCRTIASAIPLLQTTIDKLQRNQQMPCRAPCLPPPLNTLIHSPDPQVVMKPVFTLSLPSQFE